jgi:hypothetical protein
MKVFLRMLGQILRRGRRGLSAAPARAGGKEDDLEIIEIDRLFGRP